MSTMLPPRTTTRLAQPNNASFSLELLSEYAHTLDAMPLDLSRIFADLRELDAVLTATVAGVAARVNRLADLVSDARTTPEARRWLLNEIAEEAAKVRPGADDKIRIATQAADALAVQTQHLTALASALPEVDPTMLVTRTRYPHVSTRTFMPPHTYETGRRRRAANTIGLMGTGEASPHKKRRVAQDEDLEYGAAGRSPRKERAGEGSAQPRARGGPRVKKVERLPSPPESIHSIASHIPPIAPPTTQRSNSNRNANGVSSHKRRVNPNAAAHDDTALVDGPLSRKENLAPSSSTSHPSLMDPDHTHSNRAVDHRNGARHLEAAFSTAARASTQSSLTNFNSALEASPAPTVGAAQTPGAGEAGEGDADGELDGEGDDGKIYCFCQRASFGNMVACDGAGCKYEWFHLPCVGLREAPKENQAWYCKDCIAKRKKDASRGGKKRSGGGGGGGGGRTNGRV